MGEAPQHYVVQLDSGGAAEVTFEDLVQVGTASSDSPPPVNDPFRTLPHFLGRGAKLTMDHAGSFQKGYLQHTPEGGFRFEVPRNTRLRKVDFTVPLPDFVRTWTTLVGDDVLIPGHSTVSSFLRPSTSNNAPSACKVSAKNLLSPCPPSLVRALHPSNPDRQVWLDSYMEEKGGLSEHDVYTPISKKHYLALRRRNVIPKAVPSMCVLLVKNDKDGHPQRAKSRIVVLGNHEDRCWSKAARYAPVLKYSSLRLLTARACSQRRVFQQADCNNTFCQATLPDDERIAVRPPVGDPAYSKDEYWLLNKTLYGLRRSPRHWYNMFTSILRDIGLSASLHDPCVYTGVVKDPGSTSNTGDPLSGDPTRAHVEVGIYVDDFVFYSTDPAQELLFKQELKKRCKVDFVGDADFFLGTAFTWRRHNYGNLSVHLSQAAFAEHTAHMFGVAGMARVPNMTPWRSGLPIDLIAAADESEPDFKRRRKVYQSLVGSINWLAMCSRPDVSPVLTFLASYAQAPACQHYKAAIHCLKYLYSTSTFGISYHSDCAATLQAFNHFPHHHDKEAYSDATPPSPSECQNLTAFSDACWGGQIGNSVPDGTPIEMFKLRSLSGYFICYCGGPISWKSIRQDQTAQSSCEAEVIATNECVKEVLAVRLLAADLHVPDAATPTKIYNDNQACVDWAASITTKGIKHLNLKENKVRESQAEGECVVIHIPGVINSSDIHTKEMKDSSHYRRLRDTVTVSLENFLKHGHTVPSHLVT